jgi:hypothetical protein
MLLHSLSSAVTGENVVGKRLFDWVVSLVFSAGGQFVARFLVTHPEYVERAVITAAATYPQPSADVTWPFGMGELHADIEWDVDTINHVDIVPNKQKWLAATQIPLTVIVGLNDTAELCLHIPVRRGRIGLQ